MRKCPICDNPAGFDGFCARHRKPMWIIGFIIALPIAVFLIINDTPEDDIAFYQNVFVSAKNDGNHDMAATACERIADAYEELGDYQQAERWDQMASNYKNMSRFNRRVGW